MINLDQLEATIAADEEKLKTIDEELNKLNRINRQTLNQSSRRHEDSPIYNIGTFPFNGQLDPRTLHVQGQRENPRSRRQTEPMKESIVESLTVKNIDVKSINGIPFSDFVFLENSQLLLPSANIVFTDSFEVDNVNLLNDGRINDIKFSRDVLAVDSPSQPNNLLLESVVAQSIQVENLNGIDVDLESMNLFDVRIDSEPSLTAKSVAFLDNLKVDTINGVAWNKFVNKLVPTHKESTIENITVIGDVVIEGEFNSQFLNELAFPSGYVLKAGPRETLITGKKIFKGELGEF